jgi:hypoxanthine phosphoribosyltransferase
MANSDKLYFSYNAIHRTVADLATAIQESGYDPDLTVAIGTGGFIPARILKTYLKKPILTVGVKLYNDDNTMDAGPKKVQWIDEVERKIRGRKVLLIDEVDDTRTTLAYCLRELLRHEPAEIAVAVLHCKDKPKNAELPGEIKRYWAGQHLADQWVVYPWDATDIDEHQSHCLS